MVALLILLFLSSNIKLNFGKPGVVYRELMPSVDEKFNMTTHLDYSHVKKVCGSRYSICNSNSTKVCGVRYSLNEVQYKDFENSCFMFLSNMCDTPGEEYYIASSGTCRDYYFRNIKKQRGARRDEYDQEADEETAAIQGEGETNAEQETKANAIAQNHIQNVVNPEPENTEAQENEDNPEAANNAAAEQNENKATENPDETFTEAQLNEEKEDNPGQETEDNTEPTEQDVKEEETAPNTNDEIATEPNEGENNDITTQVTDSDISTPKRIRLLKAGLRQGKTTTKKKGATTTKNGATTKKNAATTKKGATTTKKGAATTKKAAATTKTAATKKAANATKLKKPKTTQFTLYSIDTAFDDHICPLSCPSTYSPVCVSANRGYGIYFKFFTFINHCLGDQYYCMHWKEFSPPPDEDEMVISSPLSWSFCGASRYIQFARFAEVASSMGHYGWLAGDYRPTHIMEPHQRIPGFG